MRKLLYTVMMGALAINNPSFADFKGDSMTYQGITFVVVEEENDDDDYDDDDYPYTVEKSFLAETNFRLTTAVGTQIGDLPGQLINPFQDAFIYGLELNGGILNISEQTKPEGDNIQNIGSMIIRERFDPGDGFIKVDNQITIGDDWFTPNKKETFNTIDLFDQNLRILKIHDISDPKRPLTDEEVKTLLIKDTKGNLINQGGVDVITQNGEEVSDIVYESVAVLEKDPNGGINNYISLHSEVKEYDIRNGKTLTLDVAGDKNYTSKADIIGNGNLTLNVNNKELTMAGNNYNWGGNTYLTGNGGKVIIETPLSNQGNLTVENVTLDLNGKDQSTQSVVIKDGEIDINDGKLTLLDNNQGNLQGVSNGRIEKDSMDGVNGGQLWDLKQEIDSKYNDIKGDINNINNNISNINQNIENGINNGNGNGNDGLLVVEGDKIVIDNELAKDANRLDISNKDENRVLEGVANGKVESGSNEAINGGQLNQTHDAIGALIGGGAKIDKDGNVYHDPNGNVLTINGQGYKSVAEAIESMGADQVFIVEGDEIVVNGATGANSVNFGNRKVTGVSDGRIEKDSTDAVNGKQIWQMEQNFNREISSINNTLAHYNTRINNIEKKVHENRKVSSAGIAGAMAMSSIPYSIDNTSKMSIGMGMGSYDGQTAFAIGMQGKMSDKSRFRLQMSYDSQNKLGVGVGVAFDF